jgi:hypothetical protein
MHLRGIACPACDSSLDLHQPDPFQPDRLLGTCPSCRAWCVLDADAAVVTVLPPQAAGISAPHQSSARWGSPTSPQ